MWQCNECEYFNDDFDELCAKCGAEHVAKTDPPVEDAQQTKVAQPPVDQTDKTVRSKESETSDKPKSADTLLIAVISVVVIAICAVGFIAFTKGMLPGQSTNGSSAHVQNSGTALADPDQPVQFAVVEDLEDGIVLPGAQSKKLATFTGDLEKAWTGLVDREPIEDQPGQLSADSIAELSEIAETGNELVLSYQQFEAYIAETNSPHLNEAAVLMRDQFGEAMGLLVATVANYRAHDLNAIHEAYLFADRVPGVVDEFGWLDSQSYRQMWIDARYQARQIELDIQYVEYYRQLAARYDGLEQVHNEFNGAMKQIPPGKVRSGVLGKDAKDYLDALEAYAVVVENFATEFEEYAATLDDLEPSDKLIRYIAMNRELAQEDHMFCFMETYMMYAKDKRLDHPVYENLGGHYEFVQETWPKLAGNYEGVFQHYEAEWILFWRPDLLEE